jgi:hypothetical protein
LGLKEKRAMEEFLNGKYAIFLKELETIVGRPVEMAVNWDHLMVDEYFAAYDDLWDRIFFTPITCALKEICTDEMGKKAIDENLSKIIVQNEAQNTLATKWASFSGGVLVLDHKPMTNPNQVTQRTKSLKDLLENSL